MAENWNLQGFKKADFDAFVAKAQKDALDKFNASRVLDQETGQPMGDESGNFMVNLPGQPGQESGYGFAKPPTLDSQGLQRSYLKSLGYVDVGQFGAPQQVHAGSTADYIRNAMFTGFGEGEFSETPFGGLAYKPKSGNTEITNPEFNNYWMTAAGSNQPNVFKGFVTEGAFPFIASAMSLSSLLTGIPSLLSSVRGMDVLSDGVDLLPDAVSYAGEFGTGYGGVGADLLTEGAVTGAGTETGTGPGTSTVTQSAGGESVLGKLKTIANIVSPLASLISAGASLFGSRNMGSAGTPPTTLPPITMPTAGGPVSFQAQQGSLASNLQRRGRASTILTGAEDRQLERLGSAG